MIGYRPELDGLRAIAVLAVIANHAGLAGAGGGYVGVDVFFVISGYLITRMIVDEAGAGRFSIAGFYERRIRRIAPAFFAMTLVTSAIALVVVPPADLRRFGQSVAATAVFGSNVLFYRQEGYFDVLARMKPMLHTWSLAVEEQFYIVFPLIVVALTRGSRRRLAAGLIGLTALSFAACVWVTAHNPRAAFYQMPLRGWELLAGALLAIDVVPRLGRRAVRELAALVGLALIGGAIALYTDATRFPGLAAAAPVVGAALVLHAHAGGAATLVGRGLGARPIAFVGKISYSLYLWHWPLLVLSAYWRVDPAPHRVTAVLAVTAIVSVLSWRYVEQPFRRRASWLTRPRLFAGMAAATAVALGFGLATYASGGWPARVSARARALDGAAGDYDRDRPRCHGSERRPIRFEDKCVYGAPAVAPSVAIWGDSMAAEPAVALGRALGARGRALRYISSSSCPPSIDLGFADRPRCAAHNADVLAHLIADPAVTQVVLIAQYVRYERALGPRYRASLAEVTARLVAAGKQVHVVYPIPTPPGRVPMMLARYVEQGRRPDDLHVDRAAYLAENRATLAFLDELTARPGVHAVRVNRALCDATRCAVYAGDRPLYFDDRHLSVAGAEHVLPAFAAVLESSQRTTGLRAALSNAAVYQALQDLLGGRRFQRRLIRDHVAPGPGMRLLDIGCGTGAIVEHVPAGVDYHGFDLSARYVEAARRRWGDRAQFWQASVEDAPRLTGGRFDRAIAIGVLHHLDDAGARSLAALAAAALADDGALVTYDPAYTGATGAAARFLLDRDRGQHVRAPDAYAALLATAFAEVAVVPVAQHLRIPYTGCIVTARRPRREDPMTPDDRSFLRRALLRRGGDLATRLAEVMAGQDAERIVRALGLSAKPGARPDEILRRALADVEEQRRWLEADDPRYGACAICATRFSIEQLRELPWADRCPAHAGSAAAAH